jgi:signal transduction histidine kinase
VGGRSIGGGETVPDQDKTAYDDLPDGVLVIDDAQTVVLFNPAAERLLGISADSAVGRDFREIVPLVDETGRDWWACTDPFGGLATRSRQPERGLQVSGGPAEGRDLLVTASYVREGARVVRLIVCLRDTKTRERHERSRADLVSTVAHELRSPLTRV